MGKRQALFCQTLQGPLTLGQPPSLGPAAKCPWTCYANLTVFISKDRLPAVYLTVQTSKVLGTPKQTFFGNLKSRSMPCWGTAEGFLLLQLPVRLQVWI